MEIRVILRGAFAGFFAGLLGFAFAKIFTEPQIQKAIDYESGRDAVLAQLNKAAGRPVAPDGPEIFSRHVQSTIGIATGLCAFGIAMGALVGVAYLVCHGRFAVRPQALTAIICGFGFLGIYMLPFVKYPANPPAIGHSFTIDQRSHLYLAMVGGSILLLAGAFLLARGLRHRVGLFNATLIAAAVFLVCFGVLIGVLPSLGDLKANVDHAGQLGYARASTETPQPITNLHRQLVYPGFPADVLWKFRWYSVINQLIIWTVVALGLGALLERYLNRPSRPKHQTAPDPDPLAVS